MPRLRGRALIQVKVCAGIVWEPDFDRRVNEAGGDSVASCNCREAEGGSRRRLSVGPLSDR